MSPHEISTSARKPSGTSNASAAEGAIASKREKAFPRATLARGWNAVLAVATSASVSVLAPAAAIPRMKLRRVVPESFPDSAPVSASPRSTMSRLSSTAGIEGTLQARIAARVNEP